MYRASVNVLKVGRFVRGSSNAVGVFVTRGGRLKVNTAACACFSPCGSSRGRIIAWHANRILIGPSKQHGIDDR